MNQEQAFLRQVRQYQNESEELSLGYSDVAIQFIGLTTAIYTKYNGNWYLSIPVGKINTATDYTTIENVIFYKQAADPIGVALGANACIMNTYNLVDPNSTSPNVENIMLTEYSVNGASPWTASYGENTGSLWIPAYTIPMDTWFTLTNISGAISWLVAWLAMYKEDTQ